MVSQLKTLELTRTKLHRPPVPHDLVARKHLVDRLNTRLNRPLSLICAPAGYGKSTLVSSWLENCELPSVWLSLDEADNDLRLFLSYLLTTIRVIFPDVGQEIQNILKGHELPPISSLTGRFVNELDKIDTPFILAIDDYHIIKNNAVHELLAGVIKHPPHAMHLVMVSRIDPPLPLTTLRAKGLMTEIRVGALRFTRKETAIFLQQMLKATIEESVVSLIEEKSEGWVTGLRLAALSLRHADDIERAIASLPDANRYVLDYFVEEIFSQQTLLMQDYLLATSVLDRFCGPLCDAIFISDTASDGVEINGQKFIRLLNDANLFVIPLDEEGRWFRYHHLFKSLLKRRCKRRFLPEDIELIHTKASNWFVENGYFEDGIQHSLAGKNVEKAVEIVGLARHDLMNREQWHRLERWLKLFSHEETPKFPHLILLRSWLDLWHCYRLDHLVEDLSRTDILLESSTLNAGEVIVMKAEVAAIRSNFAYWMLKPSSGVDMAKQVLRDLSDEHECARSTAVFGLGPLYQMLGEVKQGERILWSYIEDGRLKNPSSQARLMASLCITLWPETRNLQQAASKMLQISLANDLSWGQSFARYFLGLHHYERNELDDAVEHFEMIVADPSRFPIQNVTHCSFLLSLSYQGLGLEEQACKVAESVTKLTFDRGNQMFMELAGGYQADLDLRQGGVAQADQWARGFTVPAPHGMQRFFNAELTLVKIMLVRNTRESLNTATELLDSIHQLLEKVHHRRLMIDTLGMQSLLSDALGQELNAFEKLSEALALAEPGGFIRPILDLGNQMGNLLKRLTEQKGDAQYAKQILTAFNNEKATIELNASDNQNINVSKQTLVAPLTKREIEILLVLSKRFSNPEIAEELFISPETVKRHLYNIYQKFGVDTRQQAVEKAKLIGIL